MNINPVFYRCMFLQISPKYTVSMPLLVVRFTHVVFGFFEILMRIFRLMVRLVVRL
jgi:hypothetical protein